jgi:inosine-uridine nucleoside N-ribohydrolase
LRAVDESMPIKLIFDTDPGVDDAAALLFLNACKSIKLLGITTVFGNADIETVTRNALYLKSRFKIAAPVAQGAGKALDGTSSPAPVHVHGRNGLGDIPVNDIELPALDARPAHRFIAEHLRKFPGEVTILAVGRLTNLAMALADDPRVAQLAKEIVIMGGRIRPRGMQRQCHSRRRGEHIRRSGCRRYRLRRALAGNRDRAGCHQAGHHGAA